MPNYGFFELALGDNNFVRVTLSPDTKNVTSDLRVNSSSDADELWNAGVSGIEFLVMNLFDQGIDVVYEPRIIAAIENTLDNLDSYIYG
jgi:hypothetical protein